MSLLGLIRGYRSSDGTAQPLRLDKATNTLQTIDYEHHEIHAGSAFHCHFDNECTNSGEMTIIAFKTPNSGSWLHMTMAASSTASATFCMYEASGLDLDEGSDLTVWNHNRNSATTSGIQTLQTIPQTGKATSFNETQAASANLSTANQVVKWVLGAAAAGADLPGQARGEGEFILKANTQYAFVVASLTNDDNIHQIVLNWYEHTDIA